MTLLLRLPMVTPGHHLGAQTKPSSTAASVATPFTLRPPGPGRKAACKQWLAPSQFHFCRTVPRHRPVEPAARRSHQRTADGLPDIGMADQFQSSSAFFGLYRGITYPTLLESPNSPVGIVPFKFMANKGAPGGLTNINTQQARALFGAGTLPLSFSPAITPTKRKRWLRQVATRIQGRA